MISPSTEDVNWWNAAQPTPEELHESGGLLVDDWPHARHVRHLSLQLFDATYPLHQLNEHAKQLLDRAAFLHNVGMMVQASQHHKHSFRLINETALPDFTAQERYEIACIARYHRRAIPKKEHDEYTVLEHSARKRVSLLAALLRIADGLDYNYDGRVLRLAVDPALCDDTTWTVLIWARPLAELDEEIERAYVKADLFERVFKRKLRFVIQ